MAPGVRPIEIRHGPAGPVVSVGGRALTGSDPAASFRRRLPVPPADDRTLYLLVSPLNGPGLTEWFAALPAGAAVITVELSAELDRALPREWRLSRRIRHARNVAEVRQCSGELIHRMGLRRIQAVYLSGGARLHRDTYRALETELIAAVQRYWRNRGTEVFLHRRWITNLFRNVVLPGRPATALRGRLGRRAVLIGAGPGLDAVLPLLRDRHRATTAPALVAIDTALPALAEMGIVPDAILAVDGQLANARDFLPWRWSDGPLLIADATTHFSIPRRIPPERRFWFLSQFSTGPLFRDPGLTAVYEGIPTIPARGSVAPAAVHLLSDILAVRELVCVGIEFWYRLPQSHGRMTASDRVLRRRSARLSHRDGADRGPARQWVPVRLRDGRTFPGDAVLADQADLMRETVQRVRARVYTVSAVPALDTGAEAVSVEWCAHWLPGIEETAETGGPAAREEYRGQDPGRHKTAADTAAGRRRALTALRDRLVLQESRLMDAGNPVMLDAGLEIALVDLPQWPVMTLDPAWMEAHRDRILRAVRDLRRRLDALLLRRAAEDRQER